MQRVLFLSIALTISTSLTAEHSGTTDRTTAHASAPAQESKTVTGDNAGFALKVPGDWSSRDLTIRNGLFLKAPYDAPNKSWPLTTVEVEESALSLVDYLQLEVAKIKKANPGLTVVSTEEFKTADGRRGHKVAVDYMELYDAKSRRPMRGYLYVFDYSPKAKIMFWSKSLRVLSSDLEPVFDKIVTSLKTN